MKRRKIVLTANKESKFSKFRSKLEEIKDHKSDQKISQPQSAGLKPNMGDSITDNP